MPAEIPLTSASNRRLAKVRRGRFRVFLVRDQWWSGISSVPDRLVFQSQTAVTNWAGVFAGRSISTVTGMPVLTRQAGDRGISGRSSRLG